GARGLRRVGGLAVQPNQPRSGRDPAKDARHPRTGLQRGLPSQAAARRGDAAGSLCAAFHSHRPGVIVMAYFGAPRNVTFDLYRKVSAGPPALPTLAGLGGQLQGRFRNIKLQHFTYTQILVCPLDTDIRDNYPIDALGDTLYIPNKNGTK